MKIRNNIQTGLNTYASYSVSGNVNQNLSGISTTRLALTGNTSYNFGTASTSSLYSYIVEAGTYSFNLGTYSNYKVLSSDFPAIGSTGSGLTGSFTLDGLFDGTAMWIKSQLGFFDMPKPAGATGGGGGLPVMTGLQAWFKSDAGITTSGGYITQWVDQSPNGIVSTPRTNDGFTALFSVGSSLNGIPSVYSPNQASSFTLPTISLTSYTVFAVINNDYPVDEVSYVLQRTPLQSGANNGFGVWLYPGYGGPGPYITTQITGGLTIGGSNINGTPQYITYNYNNSTTTSYVRQNGSQVALSATAVLNSMEINALLSGYTSAGQGFIGKAYEVIIYNTSLSAGEVTSMESYLTTRYGL